MSRYVFDIGSANVGHAPASFNVFARADTFAALTQPTIYAGPVGLCYFDYVWTTPSSFDSITFQASYAGVNVGDTIQSPVTAPGNLDPNYVLDFGPTNAGKLSSLSFTAFCRNDTWVALAQPTFTEIGSGKYFFTPNWANFPGLSISFKATIAASGIELSDTINAPSTTGTLSDWDTAGNIINRTAIQLGLIKTTLANAPDPYASTDQNILLLTDLLASVGDRLQSEGDWPQLRKEYVFTTNSSQNIYPLPSDFHEMVDQSGWNRSSRMPLAGPATSQEWQYLKSRAPGLLINVVFRLEGGVLDINPGASPPIATVAFEYISSNWAASYGQTAPNKSYPSVATDLIWFDSELVMAGLKLYWLLEKNEDAEAANDRFDRALGHAIEKSTGAVTISLDGALRGVDRLIDDRNLPITGFAQ